MKKKALAAFLALSLALMGLVGCGDSSSTTSSGTSSGSAEDNVEADAAEAETDASAESDNPYAGIDISQPVEITMYVLGTEPADKDIVVDAINEILKEKANATLNLQVIPLSEYSTRYPLILSGGENVDLIYAAALVSFSENVGRNAFLELTDDFLNTYMPQTVANMPEEAFKQTMIDGKLYAIPRNESSFTSFYSVVAVRGELMEKYGMDELTSFEDYEEYLFAVAENESGIYGFYNMPTHRPALYAFMEVKNNMHQIVKGDWFMWRDDGSFDIDEVDYYFTSEEYREYALKMAEWAQAGVWPSDAIAGTITPQEYFNQGRSASFILTGETIDSYRQTAETAGITDMEVYDIFPDSVSRRADYSGDAIAIPYTSENPERAAMVLDLLKFDPELHMLIMGGIEGEHYIYNEEDNTRTSGPSAANYSWGGIMWAIRDNDDPKEPQSDEQAEILEALADRELGSYWPCSGFSFDKTAVKTQATLIESIISEYSNSFDLGTFGDNTEAKLDEFVEQLESAGLEEVKTEYLNQLSEYISQ